MLMLNINIDIKNNNNTYLVCNPFIKNGKN